MVDNDEDEWSPSHSQIGQGPEEEPLPGEDFDPEAPEHREVAAEAAMERSDFLSLMGHFYRGEVGRATTWRDRLDKTSNWAVVITATLITWAFSTVNSPHGVIVVGMLMVTIFLVFEARRYRMYDVWRSRVRLLEENLFANALHPKGATHREWRKLLGEDLRAPAIKMSYVEAIGRRLRRIYLYLLVILLASWFVQLSLLSATPFGFAAEAAVGIVPGEVVVTMVLGFYGILAVIAFWPQERQAKGAFRKGEEHRGRWKEANNGEP